MRVLAQEVLGSGGSHAWVLDFREVLSCLSCPALGDLGPCSFKVKLGSSLSSCGEGYSLSQLACCHAIQRMSWDHSLNNLLVSNGLYLHFRAS